MILKIEEFFGGGDIPQFRHLVITSRGDQLSVNTPSNGVNAILVALHRVKKLARPNVPDLDFAPTLWWSTARGQHFPIGTESNRAHVVGVAGKRGERFAGDGVDQAHVSVATHGKQLSVGRDGRNKRGVPSNLGRIATFEGHFPGCRWRRSPRLVHHGFPVRRDLRP